MNHINETYQEALLSKGCLGRLDRGCSIQLEVEGSVKNLSGGGLLRYAVLRVHVGKRKREGGAQIAVGTDEDGGLELSDKIGLAHQTHGHERVHQTVLGHRDKAETGLVGRETAEEEYKRDIY